MGGMARDFPHLTQPNLELVVAAVRNVGEALPISIAGLRIELATRQQRVDRLWMACARRLEQAVVLFELHVWIGAQLKELKQDGWPDSPDIWAIGRHVERCPARHATTRDWRRQSLMQTTMMLTAGGTLDSLTGKLTRHALCRTLSSKTELGLSARGSWVIG